MKPRVLLVWWMVCVLWSSTFLFIRLGLRDIPPFTFAWMRLAIAAAVLGPLAIAGGSWRSLTRRELGLVSASGLLLLGVNYALVFWGAQFVPSGLVAILQSATPVIAMAFGWLLGSEQVTPRKTLGFGAGILGVLVIFGAEVKASNTEALTGAAAVFGGSVCVALAYVSLKSYARHLPHTVVTALQCLVAVLPMAVLAFAVEGAPRPAQWPATAWTALLYLGLLASVVAFWLNYWLLRRMDASTMLMMGVAEVPIAVALGSLVFGERLPAGTLLGAMFVLGGVMFVLGARPTPSRAEGGQ